MLHFVFSKLFRNKLLFLALTASVILCVTSVCVIPIFNDALRSRMLLMSFNDITMKSGYYSNLYSYSLNNTDKKSFKKYSNLIENDYIKQYDQPVAYFNRFYTSITFDAVDITYATKTPGQFRTAFMSMNNYKNNIRLRDGKMPSDKTGKDGTIEVIISNDTVIQSKISIGRIYNVAGDDKKSRKVKIVGVYDPIVKGASSIINAKYVDFVFICDIDVFEENFIVNEYMLNSAEWNYYLDFTYINISDLPSILNTYSNQIAKVQNVSGAPNIVYNGIDAIKKFVSNEKSLLLMLIIYITPMFFLLLYCIFFISKLIVENDKNEISVLQSRGASKTKMMMIYLTQSLAIVIIPFIIAPFLAAKICETLGNTTGFLEFGKNLRFITKISITVFLIDIVVSLLIILIILVPSFLAFRVNIVDKKLISSEIPHKPFWRKFYMDIILIIVSGYGYYNFALRQQTVVSQKFNNSQIPVDPLTYLIMLAFLTGAGLMFMRVYPLIIGFVSNVGRRIWSAPIYSSLQRARVLRDKEQFVILFIIISISLGLFSANSARTINTNLDDFINYNGGADMKIKPIPANTLAMLSGAIEQKPEMKIFTKLQGTTGVTLVSIASLPSIYANFERVDNLDIIGIDSKSYSKVAWSRPDMLEKPLGEYVSMLRKSRDACIISKSIADKMKISSGDEIEINRNDKGFEGGFIKVAAVVDAWPGYTYIQDEKGKLSDRDMIIVNLPYLEKIYGDVTYEIWAKTDSGATAQSIIKQLYSSGVNIYYLNDYKNDINISLSSSDRQSLNALLTFSFIIILLICLIGFILYWLLSIKSRAMQFGMLRAIGMSKSNIYMMIIWEQFFISFVSAAYAILTGYLTSRIFINIIKVTFGADQQIIPFEFFTSQADYYKIGAFFSMIFIFTVIPMIIMISRINISKAIKFGEQ
ncbi:MAG: ABC transporter permease [Saccharofermentanales bacterium]